MSVNLRRSCRQAALKERESYTGSPWMLGETLTPLEGDFQGRLPVADPHLDRRLLIGQVDRTPLPSGHPLGEQESVQSTRA